ncbi:B12-binding domain-containing radical SAM protein [Candidatus Bathyarchaeota archaeon]|nr:B12-binding domain-containing radical SAM protein [Candidatus Bathyarchaeota archaeon]
MKLPPRFIPINVFNANVKPLIVDALASGKGIRHSTQDVIGAGPRTVAGLLEVKGFSPVIAPVDVFLDEKSRFRDYNVLLISGMTSDLPAIQKSVRKWRKSNSGPVIIGGPAASEPDRVLSRTGGDIAVTGEGEYSLLELLDGGLESGKIPDNLEDVRGISYRLKKEVRINQLRPVQPKKVFTDFPPSTSTITGYRLYKSGRVYVEAVRGCSNFHRARLSELGEKCTYCEQCTESGLTERYDCPVGIPPGCGYCSVPSLYGPPKSRSSELIIDETEKLLTLGVHRIVLSAPGFLDYQREALVYPEPLTDPRSPEPNYEQVEELLSGLTGLPEVERGEASIMIENMKAALVTERAASILGRYLKGTPVSVGFETGSDEHSRLLGRPDSPSETLVSLKRLKEAGMKPYVYFIHGLPGQNNKTADETVDMIKRSMQIGADRVILYRFQSLPASTFSQCSSGAPATQDSISRKIYDAAQEVNMYSKETLVGDIIKVVIAEKYSRDRSLWVAYPLLHGPVMLLKGDDFAEGDVINARVSGVASERMVYGIVQK